MRFLTEPRTFPDKTTNPEVFWFLLQNPREGIPVQCWRYLNSYIVLRLAQQILQHNFFFSRLPEQVPHFFVFSDLLIGFAGTINHSCVEGPQGPSLAWDVWIYFICLFLFFSLQFSLVCVLGAGRGVVFLFFFFLLIYLTLSILELFA